MNILITGSKGFIGRNLVEELKNRKFMNIFEYDLDSTEVELDKYTKEADFIFHLAGVNRTNETKEFMEGNFGLTSILLNKLKTFNNLCPIMISSSIQAELDNPYGESKRAAENLMLSYGKEYGVKVLVYRFANVFGKWCRPNYNSAVTTFSYNIARDLPIQINDSNVIMNLIYIDDLVKELINALEGNEESRGEYCYVSPIYTIKIGDLVDLLYSFNKDRENGYISDMKDPLSKKLYSTYLSYLPYEKLKYDLKMNIDNRGSFTEFIKTIDRGQVSINLSKPTIIKGNHWHHTKNEKFVVIAGKGVIRLRKIGEKTIHEYFVSEDYLQVVDIPPGYTHNIENLGDSNMVTIIWANELFDPNNPDTYYLEV